jgi:hypothetical protein
MFMTPELALVVIALKFLIGSIIGLGVVALVYRTRFLRGAIFGGVMFLLASGLAGWADSHAAFMNGRRVDIAPWGENLWLRNRIAGNGTALCIASCCGGALLAGIKRPPKKSESGTSDQQPI